MEVTTSTGAAALKTASSVASATRAAMKKMRVWGTYQVEWLQLDAEENGFTADDLGDIHLFFDSQDMRPLLSLLAITLVAPDLSERSRNLEVIRDAFENSAKRWTINNNSRWGDRIEAAWMSVLRIYDSGAPRVGADVRAAAQEFSEFIQTPLGSGSSAKSGAARYLERLGALASDIARVVAAIDTASQIREALADAPAPPIITYTETAKPATFNDLYVTRSLMNKGADLEVDSSQLGPNGGPFRVVVQGAPGAGKSTFVRHLRQELAQDDTASQAVLLLTVRRYFNTARNQTLHEYLYTNSRSSLNIEIDKDALRDALTLGLVIVIFDGLDEITDINLRADMVERIVSFGREYPAVSILVTSRAIGYDRAPLPPKIFTTLTLDQYSPVQSEEYVRRWFTFIDRDDLILEFSRESQTVTDLKANPLLLSLLCVLYRERGSIPRRRRDIYASCADLLFHTWDSHRHIGQPEELHANGDRIMQEIARWVYNSQTAQSGLTESVIQKCIGNYLRDNVGVEEGEARRRASEFLEFCATRAWLLANIGNQYGERVFGFTHRTFFEYFAAEAFARQNSSPEKIASDIVGAHEKDATSVLPELLLQAFDDKVDRGAAEVFKTICSEARDEVLILRLMEGVPLPSRTREVGFSRVMEIWNREREISEASFVSILMLNPDARHQFIKEYLTAAVRPDHALLFLSAWASLDLAGRAHRHQPVWSEIVRECAGAHASGDLEGRSPALLAWLWHAGFREQPTIQTSQNFFLSTLMGDRVGYLWLAIERLSHSPELHDQPDIVRIAENVIAFAKRTRSKLPYDTGFQYEAAVGDRLSTVSLGSLGGDVPDGPARWAILYAVALLDELGGMSEALDRALFDAFGSDPEILTSSRAAAFDRFDFPTPAAQAEAAERLRGLPVWLRSWAKGNRSFVAPFGA